MVKQQCKLVIFDMDGPLLNGRTIFRFAEQKHFTSQLESILKSPQQPYEKSIKIARLLAGIPYQELLDVFRTIPLQEYVETVMPVLRKKQVKTALVTDGYQRFANDLKKRLGLNYAFGNRLMIANQVVTGDLLFQNKALVKSSNGKIYSINKRSVLEFLCMILDIPPKQVIAIGDGEVDIDMITAAGVGIAYRAASEVQHHATVVTDDLRTIIEYLER
jgi:HAD superfamily phosphoserine phosphatase-like hydrolase